MYCIILKIANLLGAILGAIMTSYDQSIAFILEYLGREDVRKVLFSFGILIISLLSRPFFSKTLLGWVKKLVERSRNKLDDKLFDAMQSPLRFLSIVLGIYLISEIYFPELKGTFVKTLITMFLFWALYSSLTPLSIVLGDSKNMHKFLLQWGLRVLKVIIALIGIAAILEIWGIKVGAVLAGLGILGAAVALGTQDLFKNLIAGFLILSERRFNEGEWIKVTSEVEGVVEQIGLRSTLIRQFDEAPVHVPNTQLADAPVVNYSRMNYRRIRWTIALRYDSTTDQLRNIVSGIKAIVTTDKFALPPKAVNFVMLNSFNASSIDILIYCFTKTKNWGEWLQIKEDMAIEIKELVEKEGASFAFPSRTIYVESNDDIPL